MRRVLLLLLIPFLAYAQVPTAPAKEPEPSKNLWAAVASTLTCEESPYTSVKQVQDIAEKQYSSCKMEMMGRVFRFFCDGKYLYFTFYKADCDALVVAMRKAMPLRKEGQDI